MCCGFGENLCCALAKIILAPLSEFLDPPLKGDMKSVVYL